MTKSVLLGYYEDADVVAEIDAEVKKCPGMQRSDWMRATTRMRLWGPAWSLVECRRHFEELIKGFNQTLENMNQNAEKLPSERRERNNGE